MLSLERIEKNRFSNPTTLSIADLLPVFDTMRISKHPVVNYLSTFFIQRSSVLSAILAFVKNGSKQILELDYQKRQYSKIFRQCGISITDNIPAASVSAPCDEQAATVPVFSFVRMPQYVGDKQIYEKL